MDHFDPDGFLSVHESGKQVVSIHMNPGKVLLPKNGWPSQIIEPPFEISKRVPWSPDSYYLPDRPSFTLDPFFHAGLYYVQEASGMFLAHVLSKITDPVKNQRILDLCAAPGGKSTMIQSLISPSSLLVSNEVIKTRIPVLYQNITKWGYANNVVSNNDPVHFKKLSGFFDVILIDAPCSGSGLFRKDPEASKEWNTGLVNLCQLRQQRIIADVWDSLKEDGFMIYCTCSYSKEENEDMVDSILKLFPSISVPLFPNKDWHIVETISENQGGIGYRFYPDKVSGEGFYLSVVQKKQPAPIVRQQKSNHGVGKPPKSLGHQLNKWIEDDALFYITIGDAIHAFPRALSDELEILKNALYLKKAGIRMGKPGEKEWIPDHELALANFLKQDVKTFDISKSDALRFLSGLPFEPDIKEKGWGVVSYQKQRLGWIKLLEKRVNNYYPKSWRIRRQDIF
jgi:16S rRNA C967 or C1407 C5-methylase (RsmB/RsmF family)/NOL1/NOP2/fmu family ribosome biogenesis protein